MADKSSLENAELKKKIRYLTDLINNAKQEQVRHCNSGQSSLSKSKQRIQGKRKHVASSFDLHAQSIHGQSIRQVHPSSAQLKSSISHGSARMKNPFSVTRTDTFPIGTVNKATLPAQKNKIPAKTKTLLGKSSALPTRTNTLPARIDTHVAQTDILLVKTNIFPAKTSTLPTKTRTVPAKSNTHQAKLNTFLMRTDPHSDITGTPFDRMTNSSERSKSTDLISGNPSTSRIPTDFSEWPRNFLAESVLSSSLQAKQKIRIETQTIISRVKNTSFKDIQSRNDVTACKEKHTETATSLDLNQHSLSSLKKLLSAKLEAQKHWTKNRAKEKPILKSNYSISASMADEQRISLKSSSGLLKKDLNIPSQQNWTDAKTRSLGGKGIVTMDGLVKSAESSVAGDKSVTLVKKKGKSLQTKSGQSVKVGTTSPSVSTVLNTSTQSTLIDQRSTSVTYANPILHGESTPSKSGASYLPSTHQTETAPGTGKTEQRKRQSNFIENKSEHIPEICSSNKSIIAGLDAASVDLLSKGDLAKELKNTEAKIKELTADLTKLKQAAIRVSSSPMKDTEKRSEVYSVKPASSLQKRTSSSSSSGSLSARKHGHSKAQHAAKYIVSKYRLNKVTTKKNAWVNSKLSPSLSSASKHGKAPHQSALMSRRKKSARSKANPYSWHSRAQDGVYVRGTCTSSKTSTYNSTSRWKRSPLQQRNFKQIRKFGRQVWMPTWRRPGSYLLPSRHAVKGNRSPWLKQTGSTGKSRLKLDNRTRGHVYIGGVLYKSSKRKLTKKGNSASTGRTISVRGVKFHMGAAGKTLKRLDSKENKPGLPKPYKSISRVDFAGVTYVETRPGTLEKLFTAQSRFRINRAIHKSIAVTAGKKSRLKKTNRQFCMFYNRFGKCNRGDNCQYLHDPDKVAVCTRFLRGTCKVKNCPFSHKVSKDKMPVCSYFMRGLCVRDDCPYRHVNVAKDAKVCDDFLKGFCPQGEKCKKKHILECPEFAKNGNCSDGKECKLLHRKRAMKRKPSSSKSAVQQSQAKRDESEVSKLTRESTVPTSIDPIDDVGGDDRIPFKKRKLPAFISITSSDDLSVTPTPPTSTTATQKTQGSLRIKPIFQ